MAEMYGWAGKVLRIDLSRNRITTEDTAKYSEKFLGGIGIGLKVMWDEVPPEVGPFDPENRLVLCPGVLTGTPVPSSGRMEVVSKSPHTYPRPVPTRSGIGGQVAIEIKQAGYDAIIIQGRADYPVYIRIFDDEVEIADAALLWGLNTFATQRRLKKKLGDPRYKILTIGPAGENLVRFACIITDTGHAAGQGGFGAVMGSKKLKAIAIRGTRGVRVKHPRELLNYVEYVKSLATSLGATPKSILWADKAIDPHDTAAMPYRYRSTSPGIPGGMDFIRRYWVKQVACASCPVGDYAYCKAPNLETAEMESGEIHCMQWYYGWLAGNFNEVAWTVKQLHDKLGINVYEFVYMIPWLLELWKRGVINEEETGIPFSKFPDREFALALLYKVARREGFGALLAEGMARVAEKLGVLDSLLREEPRYGGTYGGHGMCFHYDPRDWIPVALLWAFDERDPFSDQHEVVALMEWSGLDIEEQRQVAEYAYGTREAVQPRGQPKYILDEVKMAIYAQNRAMVKDSLGLCDWVYPMILSPLPERKYLGDTSVEARLFSLVTGIEVTEGELLKVGERLWNLKRAIQVREGRRREDDTIPDYFFTNVSATGSPPLDRVKWERIKDCYYELRGWDKQTGVPTKEKLEELGLEDIYKGLRKRGAV